MEASPRWDLRERKRREDRDPGRSEVVKVLRV